MKIQEQIAAKKVNFAVLQNTWDCHAVQFTILFTPFIQATTSLKEVFVSAAKSSPDSSTNLQENDMSEPAKKKTKIADPAASCNSRAAHNDSSKTFFCKEHYEFLSKPAKKYLIKVKP